MPPTRSHRHLGGGNRSRLQTNADGSTSGPGSTSAGNGDININAQIDNFGNSTLTLQAYNDININASIYSGTFFGGGLVSQAGGSVNINSGGGLVTGTTTVTAQGNITINGGSTVSITGVSTFTAGGNFVTFTNVDLGVTPTVNAGFIVLGQFGTPGNLTSSGGATLNSHGNIYLASIINNNGGTVTINADAGGTGSGAVFGASGSTITSSGQVNIFYHPGSYTDQAFFPGVSGGGSLTAWKLVSTPDQFAALNNLSGPDLNFALNHDIDFTGATTTISNFNGTLNGFGHAILNPSLSLDNGNAALIGTNSGTIENLGIVGGSFTSNTGSAAPLALTNNGTITSSFAASSVSSNGGSAGGLVLTNGDSGTINGGSWASGSVTSSNNSGGLVASNFGIINNSYAEGAVRGGIAGGLVGENMITGQIRYAYALGSVNGLNYAGGLVGQNDYFSGSSSGEGAGRNAAGGDNRGGGFISDTYAAGAVRPGVTGGIVGNNQYDTNSNNADDFSSNNHESASVFYSYWDVGTTGQSQAFGREYALQNSQFSSEQVAFIQGIGGSTGQDPYQLSTYELFNHPTDSTLATETTSFNSTWYIVDGATRPLLNAEYSTTIQNAHQLQLIDMNPTATYTLARNIDVTAELATPMWTYNGFSPISPVVFSTTVTEVFQRNAHAISTGTTTTYSQSGNVNQEYITYFGPLFPFNDPPYTQTNTTYGTQQSPQYFTGTLNGQGYTITGLSESQPNNSTGHAGLFDTVYHGGTVANLGIVGGAFSTYGDVGAIAAENDGTITASWASGGYVSGTADVGGLVGTNFGTVTQSYASATVTSFSFNPGSFTDNDGGLIGEN